MTRSFQSLTSSNQSAQADFALSSRGFNCRRPLPHVLTRFNRRAVLLSPIVLCLFLLACTAGSVALDEITPGAPAPSIAPAMPLITPILPAPTSLNDLGFSTPAPIRAAIPTWWPADLFIPNGFFLTGGDLNSAIWTSRDLNVDDTKDSMTQEGKQAGYTLYTVTQSQGSIYDLLFVKGTTTFALNLTQGTDTTILTGRRVGTLRLHVSGFKNLDLNLPLRERLDTTPGSEVSLGTSVPSTDCDGCQYYINVHIAPFAGIGSYASQPPGTYIIDVEFIGGGTAIDDDFRWAKSCTVQVKDEQTGGFDCRGLENINDNTKVLDISGQWQQPTP